MMSLLLALPLVLSSSTATAPPSEPAAAAHEPVEPLAAAPFQLHLDGGLGVSTAGLNAGAIALVKVRPLALGVTADFSGLFSSRTSVGLAVGGSHYGVQRFGVDVLGEVGITSLHVAGGLLSDDPGVTGTIPYAGARAGVRWYLGAPEKSLRPTLGLWLVARADLSRETRSYTYQERSWLNASSSEEASHKTIGGAGEIGLRFSVGFDLSQ